MIGYPPALRGSGFVAPRAIGRLGAALHEARMAQAPVPRPPIPSPPRGSALIAPQPGSVAPERRTVVRLWLPTTALFLLLSPFAVLLAPLGYLAPAAFRPRPFATVLGVGRLLLSLGGTVIDVDTPEALVTLRLF
jgi:hypothetical protein